MKKLLFILPVATFMMLLLSFTVRTINNDFLKALGLTQSQADDKITNSILGGYLDAYGLKNAKNIALGNRSAVTKDLLNYTKSYVNSPAFIKEYEALKERKKPVMDVVQTPEELRASNIEATKKMVTEAEAYVKKADASNKAMFETLLVESKKQLALAEDPNNKNMVSYAKNYPNLLKMLKENYDRQLETWETEYPSQHLQFVGQRLLQFLEETKDIDFTAELVVKNNKKVFVNPAYESKSRRWKMAFRAGKEVVEPARAFVEQWLAGIK